MSLVSPSYLLLQSCAGKEEAAWALSRTGSVVKKDKVLEGRNKGSIVMSGVVGGKVKRVRSH